MLLAICLPAVHAQGRASEAPQVPLREAFASAVPTALDPPDIVAASHALLLDDALAAQGIFLHREQFVLLVDRAPTVQALMLMWGSTATGWSLVGAAPVSTGLPGRFEHFATPLGAFAHSLDNLDFRAEGTRNALGIRGYGRKGMRVYDFGWVPARKGWGDAAWSVMRLQVHATDPDVLEPRLGSAQSKGCIRIPAAVNEFLDVHGVLDADYDEAADAGRHLWVLREDRQRSPWAGRWLVVIDSQAASRPLWATPTPALP
ncbi:MAG TPA: murein L,D-transpeptidase [Rhizobacter sp.]